MSISFQLGISSVDAVTLLPELDYKSIENKIQDSIRTKSGRYYQYNWGDYRRFELKAEYVPCSIAAVVNSWWSTSTELKYFVNSDSVTSVYSVMVIGTKEPFAEYQPPYTDKMKAKIILETY